MFAFVVLAISTPSYNDVWRRAGYDGQGYRWHTKVVAITGSAMVPEESVDAGTKYARYRFIPSTYPTGSRETNRPNSE